MHHSPTHRGHAAHTSPEYAGFSHRRDQFEALVDHALSHAKKLGATDAGAEASEACGLSVSVRKGELETVERNRDKSLGVTVYVGNRRGNASTSDFSMAAIERTVQAAHDIARFTAEDPFAALPEEGLIAHDHRDLRNALGTHIGLVVEDAAEVIAIGKHLILVGQIGPAGVDQIDAVRLN